MITLRALSATEFATWFSRSTERQAEDRAWASGRSTAEELAGLQQMIPVLLPQGPETPGHNFRLAENDGGDVVGFVWFGTLPGQPESSAFLFDVFVEPAHRRKGHARAILSDMMASLAARGIRQFALHVRDDNLGARALYESLGFEVASKDPLGKTCEMARAAKHESSTL